MPDSFPVLRTEHLILRLPAPEEACEALRYSQANLSHLAESGPKPPSDFLTEFYWRNVFIKAREDFHTDAALRLCAFEQQKPETMIATVNFTQIFRKGAQFAYLGYGVDQSKQGQGYMFEAISAALQYVFKDMNLHRIMANYMPSNERSGNLLKRLGFTVEGYARDYLLINGSWRDHILTSLTNTKWQDFQENQNRHSQP
jgi:[ribosomal protein S5]-alanine N-acetyltransferase